MCLAIGVGLLAVGALSVRLRVAVLVCGAVPSVLAALLLLRRLILPRTLELGSDALWLPAGFLRTRVTKIPYADVIWTHEVALPLTAILKLRTPVRTFEILSTFLPDMTGYVAVRGFVNALVQQRAKAHPVPRQAGEGTRYCFQCTYTGSGAVFNAGGALLWRVKTRHEGERFAYPYGFFQLPDFVISDTAGQEVFRVRRERRLPRAQFVMVENGRLVCTLRQQSLLLNKYTLDFAGGPQWTFHMPLFTVNFNGVSETGATVRARLWTHNIWYVEIDSAADRPQLVAALAFIHRERLRCV